MTLAHPATGIHVHPTALVETGAEFGAGVIVGPFCHVGPNVKLGANVELMSHCVVTGDTTLEDNVRVFPHAVLGGEPQNLAYKGERTTLRVGKNTVIREGVTMHLGTGNALGETVVGENCMFLAYSHVAHDCIIGDHVTFANNVMIGGHTRIDDRVIVGGGAAIHQFCHIGHHAFIGGMAGVEHDVIPFGLVMGNRAHLAGLNLVGMKRSGMARDDINALRHGFKKLFADNGVSLRENAAKLAEDSGESSAVRDIAMFVLTDSKRKFTTPAKRSRDDAAGIE
ncbi:acyl-ACP--UDP-N-acetylglucosamine O-acyltransferase [Oricola sp.]|uniref:acyl-ACP--UDP-N-acetylglucosamine O-acyltransferase n=1 Tax=Oricola sp. TaxID=1979950 RepID=UPI003BA8FAA0